MVLITATTLPAATLAVAGGLPGPAPHRTLGPSAASATATSRAVFERRILPLLRANNPSTCSKCHLSGVDLKDYICPRRPRPSPPCATGRCTSEDALGDPKGAISRVRGLPRLIMAAVRDPCCARASALTVGSVGPAAPDTVIRHTRIDSVVASFTRNVWSQQGWCMTCNQAGTPDNDVNVKKFGARVACFKPDSPEATMRARIAQGDVEQPARSLLLLKPLGKVPHGGGVKMLFGDAGYKMFRAWMGDHAACVKG